MAARSVIQALLMIIGTLLIATESHRKQEKATEGKILF